MNSGLDLEQEMNHWPPSDASVRCPFSFMSQAKGAQSSPPFRYA